MKGNTVVGSESMVANILRRYMISIGGSAGALKETQRNRFSKEPQDLAANRDTEHTTSPLVVTIINTNHFDTYTTNYEKAQKGV